MTRTRVTPAPEAAAAAGDAAHWVLARLKPGGLDTAMRNLARQGFGVFAPRHRVTRRQGGRFRDRLEPMFPGYLFVETASAPAPWRRIDSTLGVARLVRFGEGAPARVPTTLVAELAARCDAEGVLRPAATPEPGQKVRIHRGPFADFVARVEALGPDERVYVLIELLGEARRVALRTGDIAAA